MKTQEKQVENHLIRHGSISSWDAIQEYRITRLSQYILLLRKKGWNIESMWLHNATRRWTEYVLKTYPS